MHFKTVKDGDFKDKKVILRCDIDVPLDARGNILDDKRLQLSVATIKHLVLKQAKQVIIIGHVGRPGGQAVDRFRTVNIAARLQELLQQKVTYVNRCIDVILPEDNVVLLENLRFHPEEEMDDEGFAKKLASLGDMYVNDAFAVSHRKHASVHAITKFLPSFAGLNLTYEVDMLSSVVNNPEYPFIAIIGGAKLETKIPVIRNLLPKVDKIFLGGAMIFSFFRSLGFEVGRSMVDNDAIELAKETLESSKDKIVLPEEIVVTDDLKSPKDIRKVAYNGIPADYYGVDISEQGIDDFGHLMEDVKTVVWNGPMGIYENPAFAKGTEELARLLAGLDAKVIVGGGDSAAAIRKLGLNDRFAHISSGGGASLALLGGKELPALTALEKNAGTGYSR